MSNNQASLNIIKTASVANAIIGDVITYKLTVSNDGNVDLNKVNIYDILSSALEFIEGSITVNSSTVAGNISAGVNFDTIKIGETNIITFKAKAVALGTVNNKANGSFYYNIAGVALEQYGTDVSNINTVIIENVSVEIKKTVNKNFAVLGEVVTYTITVYNRGAIALKNVFVRDIAPGYLEIVDGTVKINGVVVNALNLARGVNIGNIAVGGSSTITYDAKVTKIPCTGKIENSATAKYSYTLSDGSLGDGIVDSGSTEMTVLEVGINNFKQISVEENLVIPIQKPDIEEVADITGTVEIIKSHLIKTAVVNSNEGQNLTGYKLVIYGKLNEVVEYTALDIEQSVHSAHYSIPFTTFIVLPTNYCVGKNLDVKADVEHIYFNQLNEREIFSNATILVKAILCTC